MAALPWQLYRIWFMALDLVSFMGKKLTTSEGERVGERGVGCASSLMGIT